MLNLYFLIIEVLSFEFYKGTVFSGEHIENTHVLIHHESMLSMMIFSFQLERNYVLSA